MYLGYINNGIPTDYPLGMGVVSSAGGSISAKAGPAGAALSARLNAVWGSNTTSEQEYEMIASAIKDGRIETAEALLSRAEAKAKPVAAKKQKFSDALLSKIPAGFGITEEMISGVPNYVIYGSALVFGVLILARKKK